MINVPAPAPLLLRVVEGFVVEEGERTAQGRALQMRADRCLHVILLTGAVPRLRSARRSQAALASLPTSSATRVDVDARSLVCAETGKDKATLLWLLLLMYFVFPKTRCSGS
eukprot:892720-Rhodomonas_salina.2